MAKYMENSLTGQDIGGYKIGPLLGVGGMAETGQSIIQTLRDELFDHIQYLSIEFFAKYEAGRLIARVISDVNVVREAITFAVVGSIREVLMLAGIIISMILINIQLTVVAVIVLLVLGVIANFWRIYAREAYLGVSDSNAKVNAELSEAFNGVKVTQAFDRQKYNYDRFIGDINMIGNIKLLRNRLKVGVIANNQRNIDWKFP